MTIAAAVWSNTGTLSGTIDGNTIPKVQGVVGIPGGNAYPGSVYTLSGTVSGTTATLQTSTWFDTHCKPICMLEIVQAALYMGSLSVEVTNDGTNVYTFYQDNNPTIGQTLNVQLLMPPQFRFFRVKATPTATNAGTVTFSVRDLGQDAGNLVLGHQRPGVVFLGTQTLMALAARTTTINTTRDFKIPAGCLGFDLWVHQTALTGTSATYTITRKDPVSGTYGAVAAYSTLSTAAIAGAGEGNLSVGLGGTATANVSITTNPSTHWGLVTTGTNTSVTSSVSISFTMGG